MAVDTQEAHYKERLIALTCPEDDSTHDHITKDAFSLYWHLSYSPKVRSILSQPESPEAKELISIVKFYLDYFPPHFGDSRESIASTVVELGYVDDDIVNRLNPWFRLFFNLKKTNTSIDELQQWLFDAGFDQPFSEYNKKELAHRLIKPNEDIGHYDDFIIVQKIFGSRICSINLRYADGGDIARLTAEILNTIMPPLNIKDADEVWGKEEKHKYIKATLVAKKLLGYELEIPEDNIVLTRFTCNNQVYGFYHSLDPNSDMFIMMRNIDCFLSYMNRPERIFVFTPYDTEGVLFVLAEPEKFKKLAEKIGFYYHDTEAEAADQNYDCNLPPSLSTLQFPAIQKPQPAPAPVANTVHQGDQRLSQRQIADIDKAADATFSGLHWAIRAFIAFILFFAAKDAIFTLRAMTTMVPTAGGIGQTIWVLTPYFVLAGALIRNTMFSTGYLFAVSMFVSLFSLGVYGMTPSHNAEASDANVFIWVPLVQLLWIFGCYYVLRNR